MPQTTTSAQDSADTRAVVGTWYDADENTYLIIAADGTVDDGDGLQWLAPGEEATISAAEDGTFILTSNLSRQPEGLELAPDGLELRSAGGADVYTKLD